MADPKDIDQKVTEALNSLRYSRELGGHQTDVDQILDKADSAAKAKWSISTPSGSTRHDSWEEAIAYGRPEAEAGLPVTIKKIKEG